MFNKTPQPGVIPEITETRQAIYNNIKMVSQTFLQVSAVININKDENSLTAFSILSNYINSLQPIAGTNNDSVKASFENFKNQLKYQISPLKNALEKIEERLHPKEVASPKPH